jgi:heme/copper-type cytochrome/quinol oxidase subunit 2
MNENQNIAIQQPPEPTQPPKPISNSTKYTNYIFSFSIVVFILSSIISLIYFLIGHLESKSKSKKEKEKNNLKVSEIFLWIALSFFILCFCIFSIMLIYNIPMTFITGFLLSLIGIKIKDLTFNDD